MGTMTILRSTYPRLTRGARRPMDGQSVDPRIVPERVGRHLHVMAELEEGSDAMKDTERRAARAEERLWRDHEYSKPSIHSRRLGGGRNRATNPW